MEGTINKKWLEAKEAAQVLQASLKGKDGDLTIADASTSSGLSLPDAEKGLHYLVNEYRGQLSATTEGELLFRFPFGFHKPWETKDAIRNFLDKCSRAAIGVLKFVVRAWVSIVIVGYVVIFALILLALTFSKSSDREESSSHSFGGNFMLYALLRLVMDSLFWTFHPFSPFSIAYEDAHLHRRRREQKVPFYERVNRFFFGPEEKKPTPEEMIKAVLQEIRAQKGRIGLFDVMRVTGLGKDLADPLMARLMLDYDGRVSVSADGGVYYEFPEMRKTAEYGPAVPAEPIWNKKEVLPPFTGNPAGSNILIFSLNAFNLVMSSVAISASWTLERLHALFTAAQAHLPPGTVLTLPQGTPLILGWIPFCFSSVLLALPVVRFFQRKRKQTLVARKNGQRGLLRAILTQLTNRGIKEPALREGWAKLSGQKPSERELTREIVKLGGELQICEDGSTVYRFPDLEAELYALSSAREVASDKEKEVGHVIYSSAR